MSGTQLIVSNPSKSGPALRFGSGSVDPTTGYSGYFTGQSRYRRRSVLGRTLNQWERARSSNQPEFLSLANEVAGGDFDPQFGAALYTVTSADGSGQFSAFQDSGGNFVYNVEELIGPLTAPTTVADINPDLNLETQPLPSGTSVTLDKPPTVSIYDQCTLRSGNLWQPAQRFTEDFGSYRGYGRRGLPAIRQLSMPYCFCKRF